MSDIGSHVDLSSDTEKHQATSLGTIEVGGGGRFASRSEVARSAEHSAFAQHLVRAARLFERRACVRRLPSISANARVEATQADDECRPARKAIRAALNRRFLTPRDSPSSELVMLNPKPRDGAAGSDDHARHDQLKLDLPAKLDRPVDGYM